MLKGLSASANRTLPEDAIRIGSFASLLFAIVALVTNLIVPFLVKSPPKNYETVGENPIRLSTSRTILNRQRLSIRQAWIFAHIISATAMFSTFLVTSQTGAIVLVACVGLSWALTLWAPFAIIGAEIAVRRRTLGTEDWERSSADGAGAIMGLHNTAISAPQILAALVCSVIFSIVQATGAQGGTAWVLRAGGCATLVAAYLTSTMKDWTLYKWQRAPPPHLKMSCKLWLVYFPRRVVGMETSAHVFYKYLRNTSYICESMYLYLSLSRLMVQKKDFGLMFLISPICTCKYLHG